MPAFAEVKVNADNSLFDKISWPAHRINPSRRHHSQLARVLATRRAIVIALIFVSGMFLDGRKKSEAGVTVFPAPYRLSMVVAVHTSFCRIYT